MDTGARWCAVLFCLVLGLLQGCSGMRGADTGATAVGGSDRGMTSSDVYSSGGNGTSGTSSASGTGSASTGATVEDTSAAGSGGGSASSGTASSSGAAGSAGSAGCETCDVGPGVTVGGGWLGATIPPPPQRPPWPSSGELPASVPSRPAADERDNSSFPWPPPRASAAITIPLRAAMEDWRSQHTFPPRPANAPVLLSPDKLVAFYGGQPPQLTHADHALRYILSAAGYVETSYHRIPDGFALVTRLEQIEADGRPKEPGRWDIDAPSGGPFSIAGYLRALFTAPPGHYRILVFALTPEAVVQSRASVSSGDAQEWLRAGSSVLPDSIAKREFGWEYNCTVLIYEFERGGSRSQAALRYPGLPAATHLAGAHLSRLLP